MVRLRGEGDAGPPVRGGKTVSLPWIEAQKMSSAPTDSLCERYAGRLRLWR